MQWENYPSCDTAHRASLIPVCTAGPARYPFLPVNTFPALLLAALKSSGVTRAELAKHLGFKRAQVTHLLKGRRNLDVEKIEIAAEVLGLVGEARAEFVLAAHLAHASDFTRAAVMNFRRQLTELKRRADRLEGVKPESGQSF
jgi:transcriptional regulator with XRE-family HTH domain